MPPSGPGVSNILAGVSGVSHICGILGGMAGDGLHELLGGTALARVRAGIRWRLERERPLSSLSLREASEDERRAVELLLGRSARRGGSLTVDLVAVEESLRRAGLAADLREAVERLDGPVVPVAAERAAEAAAWAAVDARLSDLDRRFEGIDDWAAHVRTRGLLKRWSRGDPTEASMLLTRLAALLGPLPVAPTPLGMFASRRLRDAHALDVGRTLRTVLLGALRARHGMPPEAGARGERATLAAAGLLSDDLLSQALVLNLPGRGATATDELLAAAARAGEPVPLPLGLLERAPPLLKRIAGQVVSVCENPWVLVTAARRLGAGAAPLVCVRGESTVAVTTLLALLDQKGARLRYHGDFDWAGIEIAERVRREVRWAPWRYDAAAYEAAVRDDDANLTGTPRSPSWDLALGDAMRRHGKQVEEEAVLDDLVADLA